MAAKRYQHGWAVSSLKVILTSSLLMKKSTPRFMGKDLLSDEDIETAEIPTCPDDDGELVPAEDGGFYCQECAHFFNDLPNAPGA